ncbi:hypothetical protein KY343_00740 [Candidatus Woesearchaeota archaeon]|nr:hypothetical protein [Candidatus Woesearchaeota archaeon]
MVHETHGLHHLHKRKRIHVKHEKYPHPNKLKRFMDHIIYFIGIVGPLMTIPQIWKIWVGKNAAGVSIISWTAYFITAFFWLTYAVLHREKPLIFTYSIWIILEAMIVIGTILY